MNIIYVPLLGKQLELQRMPRSMARFERYLGTMLSQQSPQQTIVEYPPLNMANPMAREHVTELLEQLRALQADDIAAITATEAALRAI